VRKDYQERAEKAYDKRSKAAGQIKIGIRIIEKHKPFFVGLAEKSRNGTLETGGTFRESNDG